MDKTIPITLNKFRTSSARMFKKGRREDILGQPGLIFELRRTMLKYPINVTYLTDGLGLYRVSLDSLLPFAEAVDMKKILSSNPKAQVVLFGEDHLWSKSAHKSILSAVELFAQVGFLSYGVELLRVDDRALVNAFEKGGFRQRKALFRHIKDPRNTGCMAQAADTHIEIFDTVKQRGIKIIPLTYPLELEDVDSSLGGSGATHFRDCFMCLALNAGLIENGKMFGLVGARHVEVNSGMPSILRKEFGYESIVVTLVERPDVKEPFMVRYSPEVRKVIPYFQTLNWRADDPLPQEGDWLVFLPLEVRENF